MPDLFTFETDALPATVRVLSFQGHEAISRPYRYEINLSATHAESQEIELDSVVNKPARLNIVRADGAIATTVHGVIASLESLHEYADGGLFRAVLVPKLWTLGLNEHSRVFVNDDLPTIIKAVLKAGGLSTSDYELKLNGRYKPIEHVCQYQESYLDFLSRWFEREGLFYYFKQEDAGEKLVIADDKSAHTESTRGRPVPYFPRVGGEDMSVEAFESFVCRRQVLPGSVSVKDYNYLLPTTRVEGSAKVETNSTNEVVRFGDNALTSGDCKRLAGFRAQELLSRQSVFHASGPVYGLETGFVFEVEEHPRAAYNAAYVATAITHTGQQFSGHSAFRELLGIDANSNDTYKIDVEAILRTVQFRAPAVTPWPRIFGIEPATIDGAADHDYAQLDDHGRYNVKIKFDEGDLINGKASTRIRMIQPHGGNPEGFHFPLRKHTEVLLVFLGGDPDRPSIIGVGPNGDNPSPITAGNHTLNIVHTGGNNHMELQDQEGQQYVKIMTPHMKGMLHIGAKHNPQHNMELTTDGDGLINTGTNLEITVGGWEKHTVTGYVQETFENAQTTTVTGPVEETYKNTMSTDVTGDVLETYGATQTTTVTGMVTEEYNGGQTTTVSAGGQTIKVTGGQKVTYDKLTTTVTGDKDEKFMGISFETHHDMKHETNIGIKSELLVGGKNEMFVGVKTVMELAAVLELSATITLEGHVGPKFGIHGLKISNAETELEEKMVKVMNHEINVGTEGLCMNMGDLFGWM